MGYDLDMADRAVHDEVKITAWLPRRLWHRAKVRAACEGRPLRLLLIEAVRAYLDRKGG
jgi:hypothetical protein